MQQTQVGVYRTIGPLVCDFYLMFNVLVNIRITRKSNYSCIILYGYRTLSWLSFDINFSSLELLVAELLSTALAKNHAKPANGDTSPIKKINNFQFLQ